MGLLGVAWDNGDNENKGAVWTIPTREAKFRQVVAGQRPNGGSWRRAATPPARHEATLFLLMAHIFSNVEGGIYGNS
jgi:hypothetical protein